MITVTLDKELEPLMPRYFELQRAALDDLDRAVADGDAAKARLLGHRMKGTGTSYGFPNITELGAAIEHAALDGELEVVGGLGAEIRAFLDNVRVVYREDPA